MADPLAAADVYMPIKAPVYKDAANERFETYFGVDVTPSWFFGYGGALIAPYGNLDTSGFRVWAFGESGTYRYFASPDSSAKIRGTQDAGELLFGYGFEGETYTLNLLVGPNVETNKLWAPDPDNPVQGTQFGAKVRADLWMNPTPRSLVAGEAEYSSAFRTYLTKAKLGFDFLGNGTFIGPEVVALGNETHSQWRVGAHLTALRFGKVSVDLSAGYARQTDFTRGAFGTVEFNVRF